MKLFFLFNCLDKHHVILFPFQVCISDPAGNVKKNPPRDCPQLLSLGNTGVSAENGVSSEGTVLLDRLNG